jgi:hypothetical protein
MKVKVVFSPMRCENFIVIYSTVFPLYINGRGLGKTLQVG